MRLGAPEVLVETRGAKVGPQAWLARLRPAAYVLEMGRVELMAYLLWGRDGSAHIRGRREH